MTLEIFFEQVIVEFFDRFIVCVVRKKITALLGVIVNTLEIIVLMILK